MTEHHTQAQINRIELHQYPEELGVKLKNAIRNYGIEAGCGLYSDDKRYTKLLVKVCERQWMENHVQRMIA